MFKEQPYKDDRHLPPYTGTIACRAEPPEHVKERDEINASRMSEYNNQINEHIKSKQALADAEKENQAREAAWKIEYNKAEQEHQKQLAAYQQEKKKYDEELASKPCMTVTLDKANKLLANNAFTVTVTNNLKSGALVYKQDKLQSGGGEIYIED